MRALIGTIVAVGLGGLLAVGCDASSSDGATSGGTSSGGATSGGTTASGTGGGTTGTGSGTSGSSSGGEPYQGQIRFVAQYLGLHTDYFVRAGFHATIPQPSCPGGELQGSCCYLSGTALMARRDNLPASDISAGDITLLVGNTTLATLTFAGVLYNGPSSNCSLSFNWMVDDALGAAAAGDASGVSQFSGMVVAPPWLAAENPSIPGIGGISRTADFNLTWTGTGSGTVTLTIGDPNLDLNSPGGIECTVPSAGGSISVPQAFLAHFRTGGNLVVSLTMANQITLSAPNATVELSAETTELGFGMVF